MNKKLFFINLIYYLSLTLVAIVFILGHLEIIGNDWIASLLIQIVIISGIPIILYSLLVSKNFKKTFSDFGFKKLNKKLLLISIGMALTLYLLNMFVANSFHSILILLGYETQIPTLVISNKQILSDFFLSACLPGLCEEIIHRGMMLNGARRQGYTRYGLIFSSILFGLMHLNIGQFFYASILGFCMGIAVIATDSIWTGVICHFTNNFLSVYFSFNKHLPFQDAYTFIENKLFSINPIAFVVLLTIGVFGLINLFKHLLKLARSERIKQKTTEIAKQISFEEMSDEEAKTYIATINDNLTKLNSNENVFKNKQKTKFCENIFLFSSMFTGIVITLLTFIMGII